jgi:hypothetical protein
LTDSCIRRSKRLKIVGIKGVIVANGQKA